MYSRRRPLDSYKRPRRDWLLDAYLRFLPKPRTVADRSRLESALEEFCDLWGVGGYSVHFASTVSGRGPYARHGKPWKVGKDRVHIITEAKLLRHLMQGRDIHRDARVWLHMGGRTRTDRFCIDIDAHYSGRTKEARKKYRKVVKTLGTPEFAVTSRGGKGINIWYFLDRERGTESTGILVEQALWSVGLRRDADYEFFPVVGTATPAVPFGMNSYPLDTKGRPIRLPGEQALLRWHRNYLVRDGVRRVERETLRELAKNGRKRRPKEVANQQSVEPTRVTPRATPATRRTETATRPTRAATRRTRTVKAAVEPAPWIHRNRKLHQIEDDAEILLATGLTGPAQRRPAQLLLKLYTQIILELSPDESLRWTLNWFEENHNGHSKDWTDNRGWAEDDMRKLFLENPFEPPHRLVKDIPNEPPKVSSRDFRSLVSYIIDHEDKIVRSANRAMKSVTRFRKALLSFMVHTVGFARANGSVDSRGRLRVRIPQKAMLGWPLCKRDYSVYLKFLKRATIRWIDARLVDRFEVTPYTITHRPEGRATTIGGEEGFFALCRRHLDDKTGPLFFGKGWRRFVTQR